MTQTEDWTSENLLGVDLAAVTFTDFVAHLVQNLDAPRSGCDVVVTTNVNHAVRIRQDPEFAERYREAYVAVTDGMPLVWLSRLTGGSIPERVTGADLFPALCDVLAKLGRHVFIVGGNPGEEEHIRDDLQREFPGLRVEVFCPSMQFDPYGPEARAATEAVNMANPDLVFVCLGMPKQELWALSNREMLQASFALCTGAALDFVRGRTTRAPLIWQRLGAEWLWRISQDPKRLLQRYARDGLVFIPMALREISRRASRGLKSDN